MTYFPDLSEYAYLPSRARMWNVGWLAPGHEFPRGDFGDARLDRLVLLADQPENATRGYHDCFLCEARFPIRVQRAGGPTLLGTAEIHVTDARGRVFCAPTLVVHYISEHQYAPPDAFGEAVDFGMSYDAWSVAGDVNHYATRFRRIEDPSSGARRRPDLLSLRVSSVDDVRSVLEKVDGVLRAHRPPSAHAPGLPGWFRERLGAGRWEDRPDVLAAWRSPELPAAVRQEIARAAPWGLEDWTDEMHPGRRGWEWLGADVVDQHTAVVTVELAAWPAPLTALTWLIGEAGGHVVDRRASTCASTTVAPAEPAWISHPRATA